MPYSMPANLSNNRWTCRLARNLQVNIYSFLVAVLVQPHLFSHSAALREEGLLAACVSRPPTDHNRRSRRRRPLSKGQLLRKLQRSGQLVEHVHHGEQLRAHLGVEERVVLRKAPIPTTCTGSAVAFGLRIENHDVVGLAVLVQVQVLNPHQALGPLVCDAPMIVHVHAAAVERGQAARRHVGDGPRRHARKGPAGAARRKVVVLLDPAEVPTCPSHDRCRTQSTGRNSRNRGPSSRHAPRPSRSS
mmetsp:Transcript_45101/g.144002  ORF Transcript_45101/g.144002 Transcript_45101/m.144002 type:complete len:246 (+) Transcript_45101:122-859(+)